MTGVCKLLVVNKGEVKEIERYGALLMHDGADTFPEGVGTWGQGNRGWQGIPLNYRARQIALL